MIASLEGFAESLHPRVILDDLGPVMLSVLGAERVGIATAESCETRFRNVAIWDRSTGVTDAETLFDARGTAGAWVQSTSCPLIGSHLQEMERFPSTLSYLLQERYTSNILMPLDLGRYGQGVLYALSRKTGTFNQSVLPAAMRFRDTIEPAIRAHEAAKGLVRGEEKAPRVVEPEPNEEDDKMVASLDEVQRAHISSVLRMTNGIVEGPHGAAEVLGLNPSTLRHRMRRLGIQRRGAVISEMKGPVPDDRNGINHRPGGTDQEPTT